MYPTGIRGTGKNDVCVTIPLKTKSLFLIVKMLPILYTKKVLCHFIQL